MAENLEGPPPCHVALASRASGTLTYLSAVPRASNPSLLHSGYDPHPTAHAAATDQQTRIFFNFFSLALQRSGTQDGNQIMLCILKGGVRSLGVTWMDA
jgi:hypothetical protein